MATQYTNPIVRGFNPDPSILCVDGVFYMVQSTFQYFPAIIIRESRDLVNWRIIGQAITRPEWVDLGSVPDSHGIWAPDISYFGGRYWIFAPLRLSGEGSRAHTVLRRQLVMWSDRPEGPYSRPVCLEVDDIDPSHFVDDGRHYLITAPGITITPIAADCSAIAGPTVQAWAGTGERAPEGPHLLKKDGWYYAILAEGGTGYGHRVSIARSRALYGPYEACPHNPILRQTDEHATLQRCGHAKLMQLPDGRWYAVYLCARPCEDRYTVLGRETALQAVTWDADDWPRMGDATPVLQADTPYPGMPQRLPGSFHDDFDGTSLDLSWSYVRLPSAEARLDERPGYFRIWTEDGDLCERRARNTLVQREEEHRYTATTRVHFAPEWDGEQAGLCCYYDTMTYVKLAKVPGGVRLSLRQGAEQEETIAALPIQAAEVELRVDVDGLSRTFYAREVGGTWQQVGILPRCTFLADEGLPNPKRHTGTMVGIFANNGGCGSRKPADFDFFHIDWIQD